MVKGERSEGRPIRVSAEQAVITGATIAVGFARHAAEHPDALALHVDGTEYSYGELDALARLWARALRSVLPAGEARVGLFAVRSLEAYVGMLAAVYARATFVPFHHSHPPQRLSVMASAADLDAVIVDQASLPSLTACLALMQRPLAVLAPRLDVGKPMDFRGGWLGASDLTRTAEQGGADANPAAVPEVAEDEVAYLMFTSGTTGTPKAVCVSHHNVRAFVANACARFEFVATDRFSQTYDQTFDPSIFDLFVAWEVGASVHVPKAIELMAPGRFIDRHQLTVWSSVPSIVGMMRRKNFLPPGRFPSLRYSMFCGEGLSLENADAWQAAAPNSVIENLYGPTEATVVCTGFRVQDGLDRALVVDGKVPIGMPFPGHDALIVDEALHPVPDGQPGELCIAGPQVAVGYWNAPAQTARAFVQIALPTDGNPTRRFYRTGDLAQRLPSGDIACLGRIDHQVKILGRRVELGEIESRVARLDGVTEVVAMGWPHDPEGRPTAVAVALTGTAPSLDTIRTALANELPEYMIPTRVLALEAFPLNVNGKVDRKAIVQRLEQEA